MRRERITVCLAAFAALLVGGLYNRRRGHGAGGPGDVRAASPYGTSGRNAVPLGNPVAALNNVNFGRILSTQAGSAGDPRIMQFAMKYQF